MPIPSNSPHLARDIGHSQILEELMGETPENRSKMSTTIVVNNDITCIQDLKEMLSNSA